MYLIEKVLNHNSILVSKMKKNYLVLEKGIGFQKKANQVIQLDEDITMYLLEDSNRGSSREIIERIEVKYLELANRILELAKHFLGNIDQNILLALADHIAFAVERMSHGLKIHNIVLLMVPLKVLTDVFEVASLNSVPHYDFLVDHKSMLNHKSL